MQLNDFYEENESIELLQRKKKYYAKEEIEQLTEMFKKQDDFNEVVK